MEIVRRWKHLMEAGPVDGQYHRLLYADIEGVRVHCFTLYIHAEGSDEKVLEECFYTTDPNQNHRSLEAALAAAQPPIESNEP